MDLAKETISSQPPMSSIDLAPLKFSPACPGAKNSIEEEKKQSNDCIDLEFLNIRSKNDLALDSIPISSSFDESYEPKGFDEGFLALNKENIISKQFLSEDSEVEELRQHRVVDPSEVI